MKKLLLIIGLMVGVAQARPVKFGFFDTPQERADKFRAGFSVGEVITGKLEVGSRTIRLPEGDWKVAGVNSFVGATKSIDSDEIRENNPHGEIFLFQEDEGVIRRTLHFIVPIGIVHNKTWQIAPPSICNPDWGGNNKYWQMARSLDTARLDCSAVWFGRIFWPNIPIVDSAKYGFQALGLKYDVNAYYLIGTVYISVHSANYFLDYAEYYAEGSDEGLLLKDNLDEAKKQKVNEMIKRIEEYRVRLKEDI